MLEPLPVSLGDTDVHACEDFFLVAVSSTALHFSTQHAPMLGRMKMLLAATRSITAWDTVPEAEGGLGQSCMSE